MKKCLSVDSQIPVCQLSLEKEVLKKAGKRI